jgi:predicted Zn finger-like uncharacterized protein
MQFICETCRANLQIADEKLRGKRLIVRCKRCGVQIRIADPALAAQRSAREKTARHAVPPPPAEEALGAEPAVWFAMVRAEQVGPLTRAEIESRIAAGEIDAGTYVWKNGMESWVRVRTIAELAALFAAPPPLPSADPAEPGPVGGTPESGLPFDPSQQPPAVAAEDALDLARWGAAELSKPAADTPVPAAVAASQSSPSVSKPEFRIGQPQRRGPLRAALLVLGIAGVASLAAFAILYERRDAVRTAHEGSQMGSSPIHSSDAAARPPEQNAAQSVAADAPGHGTVPSPDVLKKKVDESMPALQGCVDEALQRDPALRVGKIFILTTVAPTGEVTSTRIDRKNIDQSLLGACLKSAARNIHFPSFNGEAFPLDIPVVVAAGN